MTNDQDTEQTEQDDFIISEAPDEFIVPPEQDTFYVEG